MRILIFGASGFLGRYIYNEYKMRKFNCIGTYCNVLYKDTVKFDITQDGIESILTDEYLHSSEKKYAIICSAIPGANYCSKDREGTYNTNVRSTIKLINKLNNYGIKCIFISSTNVFDGCAGYYSENDLVKPMNEYGRQKVAVEEYLLEKYPRNLIVRLSKVVGCCDSKSNLLFELFSAISSKAIVRCIDGLIYSPTYAGDVAKAIYMLMENDCGGIFHVSNKEIFSREELALQLAYEMGSDINIVLEQIGKFDFIEPFPLKNYLDSSKFIEKVPMNFTTMRTVFKLFLSNMSPTTSKNGLR